MRRTSWSRKTRKRKMAEGEKGRRRSKSWKECRMKGSEGGVKRYKEEQ